MLQPVEGKATFCLPTGFQDVSQKLLFEHWAVLQVFDDYLQQLGEDTAAYVRTVCQTIVLTVPKAVIHCQVPLSPCPIGMLL